MAIIVRKNKLFTGLGGGGGASLIRRHDFVDGTPVYDYCGTAPTGTLETAAKWTITRLTIAADGSVSQTGIATNVAWTDRYTATYV